MFSLLVQLRPRLPACVELDEVLRRLVALAAHEPGTLYYGAHHAQDEAGAVWLYEVYQDRAAWEAHLRHEPVKAQLAKFDALLACSPEVTFLEGAIGVMNRGVP